MSVVVGPKNKPLDDKENVLKPPAKSILPIKPIHVVSCDQGAIRAVRFNSDGNYCLTCGSDKSIKLWNPEKNVLIKRYTGHGYDVLDAAGSCDNSQLASCGSDKTVIYWDVGTGQIIRRYRGHAGRVNCVAFNEESTVILSGSVDSSVRAWDCRSRKSTPIQVMDEAKDSVSSLQVTDHELLTSSIDGRVRRYDLRVGTLFTDYIGAAVTCAKFSKDGQCVLTSSHDDTLRLLDIGTGEMLGEYVGHKNSKYMVECGLNKQDDHVVSGSEDGFIYIWDLIDAKIKEKLQVRKNKVIHSIALHPQHDIMLAACEDKMFVYADDNFEVEE